MGKHLVTRSSLAAKLREAGIRDGDTVCAHSSVSALGYVCGGQRTIIEALTDAVGNTGTVMMPTFSRDTSNPVDWKAPPAPKEWLDALLDETPPYDPALTPTIGVGSVPELFRTFPGVLRSGHPISSVAARGPNAKRLTENHELNYRFGPTSPWNRLILLGGKVAMIGAPFGTMSLLHLTQYHDDIADPVIDCSACMIHGGKRTWVHFTDIPFNDEWMPDAVQGMVENGDATRLEFGASYVLVVDAVKAAGFALHFRQTHGV